MAAFLFLGLSFLWTAFAADGLRMAGSPSWGFLVFPIGSLAVGSILFAFGASSFFRPLWSNEASKSGASGTTANHSILMGSSVFLITAGIGLTTLALIVSSAFFYACAPSECSTDVPVPANNLYLAWILGLVGLGILAFGGISFVVSRFLLVDEGVDPERQATEDSQVAERRPRTTR
ncbi:MAG: hypothetical protein WB786_03220 [Thermoplasmata archaeon]